MTAICRIRHLGSDRQCGLGAGHKGMHSAGFGLEGFEWTDADSLQTVDADGVAAATGAHDRRMASVLGAVEAYRLEAAKLLVAEIDKLAAAGVRVFEVGDGPTRVRVELEAGGGPGLIRRTVRDMLRVSAPDHPAAQADEDDPEQADQDSDDQPSADVGAAEPAGDDLDLAHVK